MCRCNQRESKQRFTIKKFKLGAASVLVGTTVGLTARPIMAEQVQPAEAVETVVVSSEEAEQPLLETTDFLEESQKEPVSTPADPSEELAKEDQTERYAGITYKIAYTDDVSGQTVYAENHSVAVKTTAEKAQTVVTATAQLDTPVLSGYRLADGEKTTKEQVVTEKQSNLIAFSVSEKADTNSFVEAGAAFRTETTPYITLERYYGNDRNRLDYTLTKNGSTVPISYKVGLTRITAEEVDLTQGAKDLGLTWDPKTHMISGDLTLSDSVPVGHHTIGVVSKANPAIKSETTLTIQHHKGFVVRLDKSHGTKDFPQGFAPFSGGSHRVNSDQAAVRVTEYSDLEHHVLKKRIKGGQLEQVEEGGSWDTEFDRSSLLPSDRVEYGNVEMTTTPFGYYLPDETIASATEDTPQYHASLSLVALDDWETFWDTLKVVKFEQTAASSGVKLEFIDKSKLYPDEEFTPHSGRNPRKKNSGGGCW